MAQWKVLILLLVVQLVKAQPRLPEQHNTSNSECFERGRSVACSCGQDFRILVGDVFVGSKLVTTNCLSAWNATINSDETCCDTSPDDCLYTVGDATFRTIAGLCNNQEDTCAVEVFNDFVTAEKCNTTDISQFLGSTNYMYVDYYCINDDRIFAIGGSAVGATRENTTIYVINDMLPLPGLTEDQTAYTFSVETSDQNATLEIYKVLTDIPCSMVIQITDRAGAMVSNWTCADNSYAIETAHVTYTDYVKVTLENNGTHTEGMFWIGFAASTGSNISLIYPVPETAVTSEATPINSTPDLTSNATPIYSTVDASTLTRNIILVSSIGFAVIFGALVIVVLYIMKRRQKQQGVKVTRRNSMNPEDYFMMSTEYKRVTVNSAVMDQPAGQTLPAACTTETPASAAETPQAAENGK